jgi:GNAT superfamily N-acetyltransferase
MLSAFLRKARETGVFYALVTALRTLLPPRVCYAGRLVLLELRPGGATRPGQGRADVHWAAPPDAQQLTVFGHSLDVVQRRLAAGDSVCVLTTPARVLGYVWFHRRQHVEEYVGIRFHLRPDDIWLFDAMVAVDQRGQGLYPRLLQAAAEDLWRQGIQRILIAVEASNRNSIRAHCAAGAHAFKSIRTLRLLGLTLVHDGGHVRLAWTGRTGWVELPEEALTARS